MTDTLIHQNLLIEAGAGTGKTTRLVKAILQALFVRKIPLDGMVALTFTKKAAGELKDRVSRALEDVLTASSITALRQKAWWLDPEPALTLTELKRLAGNAAAVLDRAEISTIHSFAYALIKRFPLATGIDPDAQVDDKGLRFDELFRREWPSWLAVELGEHAPREALWLELLSGVSLSEIERTARRLADFQAPPEALPISDQGLVSRLEAYHHEIRMLAGNHPGSQLADRVARACEEAIGAAAHGEWKKLDTLPEDALAGLAQDPGGATRAWGEEDLGRLKVLQRLAGNLRARGDRAIALLTELLQPFIASFRKTLLSEGCLTHSALLYLSSRIVKQRADIRTALAKEIQFILIDESQDTDPLQLEFLLYLAAEPGTAYNGLKSLRLAPGKLFIVGDPKQSIYRFRGADIAAYEQIGQLVVQGGGYRETLGINYRSQAQIIHIVNAAFERMIRPIPDISPPYVPVAPHHPHDASRPLHDVQIWLADSAEKQTVEEAQSTEAEYIARWIVEAQGALMVQGPRESQRPLLYSDVALIFRTYGPMDRYIEALRRHNVPFAVESERYFFTTPEVTDFVNLLRAADDPSDLLSLVGFLRSPLGGITDEEILRREYAGSLEQLPGVRWLRQIGRRLTREPLADVLRQIFEDTYVMELAARSYHQDQTLANLLKLRRLLEEFAAEGAATMGLLLEKLMEFFAEDKIEGENPLADEAYNAVRILTIHKAKGLEFPVVFLPSLHSESRGHAPEPFVFDWRSQRLGLQVKDLSNRELFNFDKLELDAEIRRREAEEENRILYVAMTRARERLVLSSGINLKSARARTSMQRLAGSLGLSLPDLNEGKIPLGATHITVRRLAPVNDRHEAPRRSKSDRLQRIDPESFAKIWQGRRLRRQRAQETPLVIHPTALVEESTISMGHPSLESKIPPNSPLYKRGVGGDLVPRPQHDSMVVRFHGDDDKFEGVTMPCRAALLGTLVHRFLESWDMGGEKCSMPAQLRRIANYYFASLGMLRSPLPLAPSPSFAKASEGLPSVAPAKEGDLQAIVEEAQRLLAEFIGSPAYEELKSASILGREVPFFYPLTGETIMRGRMDILYRLPSGQLVIGDYKTDAAAERGALQREVRKYALQADAYREAAQRALGETPLFKAIFLRLGQAATL